MSFIYLTLSWVLFSEVLFLKMAPIRRINPSLLIFPPCFPLFCLFLKAAKGTCGDFCGTYEAKEIAASGYRGSKENRLQAENISPGPPGARVHDIFSTDWPWGEVGSPRNSLPKFRMGGGWLFSSSSPAGCIINTFPETKWEKLIPYVMKQLPLEWRSSKVVKRHDLMSSVHTYHSTQHLHRSIHS